MEYQSDKSPEFGLQADDFYHLPKEKGIKNNSQQVRGCLRTNCSCYRYINTVNTLNVRFACNRKKPKIKSDTLTGSKDQCGLFFPNSLQCAWVLRMPQGAGKQCMTIPSFYLGKVGGPFIFDCDYDINLLNVNIAPAFI